MVTYVSNDSKVTSHIVLGSHPFRLSCDALYLIFKLWLNRWNKKQVISAIIFSEHFRVHAYWTGNSVVSLLSIKSAISEDTGNYSCILPNTGEKVTASLHILKGIFYSGSNVNVMEKMESHLPLAFGMN